MQLIKIINNKDIRGIRLSLIGYGEYIFLHEE